nr:CLL_HP1_G0004380.mRNA.1.CDS.1 [Saccharomyces cerevisiae]
MYHRLQKCSFSDRIESSPIYRIPGSSPKPSPSSKPGKSILRNRLPSVRTVSDLSYNKLQYTQHKLHNGNIFTSPYKETKVNPRALEYWVSGEIHGLVDNESVSSLKKLLRADWASCDKNLKITSRGGLRYTQPLIILYPF